MNEHSKDIDLDEVNYYPAPELTDNLGHRISDDQNSERAGVRGPTLLEDFWICGRRFTILITSGSPNGSSMHGGPPPTGFPGQ